MRAAERVRGRQWHAVAWVKAGIMLAFRVGELVEMGHVEEVRSASSTGIRSPFATSPLADGVRIVPGGSIIRRGAYVAPGVICMPPMLVNLGSHVGSEHHHRFARARRLVRAGGRARASERRRAARRRARARARGAGDRRGRCLHWRQLRRVRGHRGAAARGARVRRDPHACDAGLRSRARDGAPRGGGAPLEIPEGAVVVPGARPITSGWGGTQQLSLQTPIIVKYRDEHTRCGDRARAATAMSCRASPSSASDALAARSRRRSTSNGGGFARLEHLDEDNALARATDHRRPVARSRSRWSRRGARGHRGSGAGDRGGCRVAVGAAPADATIIHCGGVQSRTALDLDDATYAPRDRRASTRGLARLRIRGVTRGSVRGCTVSIESRASRGGARTDEVALGDVGRRRLEYRTAEEHDAMMAWMSHLPQLASTALAATFAARAHRSRSVGSRRA